MTELNGKKALVTGGSRGIGAAIATHLAVAGADVAITYHHSSAAAEETVVQIQRAGRRGTAIQVDAAQSESVIAAVNETVSTLGGLDILVNNAGIFEMKPVGETTLEDFDRMVAVNVRAVFAAVNEAVKQMGSGGRIINIGSVNGDVMPFAGGSLYAMSKGAVAAMSQGWARDLGPKGITVNTIQPGPIDTDMNPADGDFAESLNAMTALGHYGKPKDIAELATFLASPRAAYITGAALNIDGGLTA
ncbi:Cyclic-di-GMP-binding biofilm dispersal mediatorprotein [Acaryochloris thomasi RCC1774]|uniref:Cyclic-di-GMP-binding biofilm dispersal mediatorprotein n=1 Tax=Acaryochloris thomasi RCC1774 TaxID=1764569 RepID=A0A2W1JYJ8_9CYAN|nr:3-oxoacyl-ACP reductase family protein [Acaryochloris thomasi]PZD73277.1 Cyclic-di-GMP-binding biofilm dispersal mediatorprotein [Acaryochloris thomasi RCC1774]